MLEIDICPECKVPRPFVQGHSWLNNGDIVQSSNHSARLAFIECENLDPLFINIGDIIGVSIEHLIVNITARAYEIYLGEVIPEEVRELVQAKQMDTSFLVEMISTLAQMTGQGKFEWVDYRYERDPDDFAIQRVMEPYSVPLAAGGFVGALMASVGGEHDVSYKEISPGLYEFTTHWPEYPAVLKEKLQLVEHNHREGDIELERCGNCGGPRGLSSFDWHLDKGIIVNRQTGRRMVMLGPAMMDPIFTALEAELDETIPEVVVEAQRRFVRTGFYPMNLLEPEADLRTQLALRGLGNLKEIKKDKSGLSLRLDNACLHLLLIGLVQGIYELTFEVESNVEWELSEQGDIEMGLTTK